MKELVCKKLILLMNILFNNDQINWFVSLKIQDQQETQSLKHYDYLINIISEMMSHTNSNELPAGLVRNFAQSLLSTPELSLQINKLVLKHFG
jgi:hypothetical protein